MDSVNVVNAVLIVILAVGTIIGLIKGLIRQVIELLGVVGSLLVGVLFSGWLAEILQNYVSLPYSPSLVISFAIIFVGGMIGFHFLAVMVQKLVRMTFLGWVDRFCGASLGLIVGVLLTSLLVTVTLELPVPGEVRRDIERSTVALFVRPVAPWLFNTVFAHGASGIDYKSIFRRGGNV